MKRLLPCALAAVAGGLQDAFEVLLTHVGLSLLYTTLRHTPTLADSGREISNV